MIDLDNLYEFMHEGHENDQSFNERPSYHCLQSIEERYEKGELLGEGALKKVYRTYDHRGQRWIAYAELKRQYVGGEYEELFIQEAWLTSVLDHPNIIKIHDVGIDGQGVAYFTMDLRRNRTMADISLQEYSLEQRIGYFQKVLDAIEYAHHEQVLHLDLKPENIQCEDYGQVMVCDWGLGKSLRTETATGQADIRMLHIALNQTSLGEIKGSPGYMAPEQTIPSGEADIMKDVRSDIFSLGAVLYYLLTGKQAFRGEDVEEILEATRKGEFTTTGRLRGREESLLAVSKKAMSPDPEKRYQTVAQLRQEIQDCHVGKIPQAERASVLKRSYSFILRNQGRVTMTLFALCIGFILLSLFQGYQASLEAESRKAERYASEAESLALERDELQWGLDASTETMSESSKKIGYTGYVTINSILNQDTIRAKHSKENKHIESFVNLSQHLLSSTLDLQAGEVREKDFRHWVYINFYRLDFRNLLKHENISEEGQVLAMYDFARRYPDFGRYTEHPPTMNELSRFFYEASFDGRVNRRKLELAFRYNWAIRPTALRQEFSPIALSVLRKHNFADRSFRCEYQEQEGRVKISTEAESPILSSLIASHYKSPLAYLNVKHLEMHTPQAAFDLALLDNSEIESLNLTRVKRVYASAPFTAPKLKQVILPVSAYEQFDQIMQVKSPTVIPYSFKIIPASEEE